MTIVCVETIMLVVLIATFLYFFLIRYAVKEGRVRGKITFGIKILGEGVPLYLVDLKGKVFHLLRTTNQ
jgi:hypothetical protein